MKTFILLGTVVSSLLMIPTAFAYSTDSHPGANCEMRSNSGTANVSDVGKSITNSNGFQINNICPLNSIKSVNLQLTPPKLISGRVVGYNVKDARICWRDAFVGGAVTYCGAKKSKNGFGAVTVYANSLPPFARDLYGQMFIWTNVPANGYSRIERYSADFNN